MKRLRKDQHSRGRESKPGPTKYETELLRTQQWQLNFYS
jgi:hypothetical protein